MATIQIQVMAFSENVARPYTVREGGTVRELLQVLHNALLAQGIVDKRPDKVYYKGSELKAGDTVGVKKRENHHYSCADAATPGVAGCAGIHLLEECAKLMPKQFDKKGHLAVRANRIC
jgi:hypothetical protein